jgi:WXG100 family type VII secretion target
MPNDKSRAHYEGLSQIAKLFQGESESIKQTADTLKRHSTIMRNGAWVGVAATAFLEEMDGIVMPSMQRLAAALGSAQQSTSAIRDAFQAAEAEAAGVLKFKEQTIPAGAPSGTSGDVAGGNAQAPMGGGSAGDGGQGDRIPGWLKKYADTNDAEFDLARNIGGMILGVIDAVRAGMNTYTHKVVGSVLEITRTTITATQRILGKGWEIVRQIQAEITQIRRINIIESVKQGFWQSLKAAVWGARSSAGFLKTFWSTLKDQMPSLSSIKSAGSRLGKFVKALPWIGLGLDVVSDAIKYYNKDGWAFVKNPEFWASQGKNILYFAGGAVLAAGVTAVAVTVGAPVAAATIIGGLTVAGVGYALDTVKFPDGETASDKLVKLINNNVTGPIGRWLGGLTG